MDKKSYEQVRDDKYLSDSKSRLSKILRKKIETTMIGALSSIEEHFGFLWSENGECSPEDRVEILDLYNKVRSEILDKGNSQARNVDAELAQYDVKWLKYSMKIPVIKRSEN